MNCYRNNIYGLMVLAGIFFLISCEKEKIITTVTTPPNSVVLPIDDDCVACHNNSYPEHSTNAHVKHTTGLYNFSCSTCHYGHGFETGTHMNGVKNITFNPAGLATRNGADSNTPTWNSDTKTCTNVYCHSNGVTADRGTDGTYTWSTGTPPFGTLVYTQTPSWNSGKITSCTFCHNGSGNMISPYTIIQPNPLVADNYPASGKHQYSPHTDNDQSLSTSPYTPLWGTVECFWCHNTSSGDSTSVNSPNLQGTYSTAFHVDGNTYFKPLNVSAGGTMANGLSHSSNGSASHCGNNFKCW